MELSEAIVKRYSCRAYAARRLEPEVVGKIFEIARRAPSAKNLQDWRFVVVSDEEVKSKVAGTTNRPEVFGRAGAIIVACSNSDCVMKCGQWVGAIDVAIILDHISLLATDLGLATCWIGSFDAEAVRRIVGVPEGVEIVELMALGYPADRPREGQREAVESIMCYDRWSF